MSSAVAAPSPTSKPELLPNSTGALSVTMWWMFACGAALLPMLPLFIKERGISDSVVALLMAVPALSATLCSQVWGYLSDMYYTRTRLLIIQSFGGAFFAAAFPFVPASPIWIAVLLFGHAACISSRISMLNALILASKGGERNYGRIRVAGSFSFGIAVLALGFLSDHPQLTVAIMWPVLIAFEVMTALSTWALVDTPPKLRLANKPKVSFRAAQRIILGNPIMRAFLVFEFFSQLTLFPAQFMQVPLLKELGAAGLFMMGTFTVGVIAEVFVFVFAQRYLRRVPVLLLMGVGCASTAVRWGLIWAFPVPSVILMSNVLHMFGFGLAYLTAVLFVQEHSPPDLKSSAQTIMALCYFSLPMLLGNVLTSWLLTKMDLPTFYGVSAVLATLALVTLVPLGVALKRGRAK